MSQVKNELHLKAVKQMQDRYFMSVMSHTPDYGMVNMLSTCGNVVCMIEGSCFEMGFMQPYGQFKYSKLHVSHIGKASDAAFERCLRLSLSAKKSDLDFLDTTDNELALRVRNSAPTIPNVVSFYKDLSEKLKKVCVQVLYQDDINSPSELVDSIKGIPLFNVSKYPINEDADINIKSAVSKYKGLKTALEMLTEELEQGYLSVDEAQKPLKKMFHAINEDTRLRLRTLMDDVNFIDNDDAATLNDSEHSTDENMRMI